MKSTKKLISILFAILAITTTYAYQDNNKFYYSSSKNDGSKPDTCCDIPSAPTTSAYNYPANISVCKAWDFRLTGSFLWILPNQEQMEFAETYYATPAAGIPGIGRVHEFNFDWKPAFKVGLGYNFDHDNWDAYIQYLRINTSMSNRQYLGSNAGELLRNLWIQQASSFTQVKGKWDLDFNIFDLEFSRPYYNGKYLKFSAHYGLRGGWIDQTFFTEGINTATVMKSTFESKSWLVGPRAGIYTKWCFEDGFRFFGNAAASLFYQKFYKITQRETYAANPTQCYVASNYLAKQLNASLDLFLGIGWGRYFHKNRDYFDLSIGYEAQLFYDQNKMRILKDITGNMAIVKAGNLMFHGLNVTLRFDF